MYILAFETSCDDTSVALLRDDVLLALSTRTQLEHAVTGWVVPEVAARAHANAIFPCIEDVLNESGISLSEIEVIACTESPWLAPSLLTGKTVARTIAHALWKPLIWVHHIEAHIFANYLERSADDIVFPSVVLTISGWHTELYLWKDRFSLELIGQTRDDAVWEAYDKVAKMLGLGFPWGLKIANLAEIYRSVPRDDMAFWKNLFPRPYLEKDSLDFSFSGLKSAVKRYIDDTKEWDDIFFSQISFAFEDAVLDVLVRKIFLAAEKTGTKSLVLAWGVSANSMLKSRILERAEKSGYRFIAPKKNVYSWDNAAMIGIRAYYQMISQK